MAALVAMNNLLLIFILLYAVDILAAVYKCTDSNGRVIYSDTACNTNADSQTVKLQPLPETETQTSFFSNLVGKISSLFNRSSNNHSDNSESLTPQTKPSIKQQNFQCDGRTYCSQMTSCAEATFFLNNCPDTKMDGNYDGIPCEKQWCQ